MRLIQKLLRALVILALIGGAFASSTAEAAVDPMAGMEPVAGDICCDAAAVGDECLAACAVGCGVLVEMPAVAAAVVPVMWSIEDRSAAGTAPSPSPGPPRA
jgi:hypothetical protein